MSSVISWLCLKPFHNILNKGREEWSIINTVLFYTLEKGQAIRNQGLFPVNFLNMFHQVFSLLVYYILKNFMDINSKIINLFKSLSLFLIHWLKGIILSKKLKRFTHFASIFSFLSSSTYVTLMEKVVWSKLSSSKLFYTNFCWNNW